MAAVRYYTTHTDTIYRYFIYMYVPIVHTFTKVCYYYICDERKCQLKLPLTKPHEDARPRGLTDGLMDGWVDLWTNGGTVCMTQVYFRGATRAKVEN
ncbi:hypothetical protein M5D96_002694 [Drosophila gunungcola]|uniref:Uncharacterized protein n=1 Tax=Drosophila gunungcola TaxID=103775 RepID=A0A9P9Z1B1_9MUSC|nr:hypothetical protein M5D96_002694 [Drosophila gunungcola]